MNTSLNRSSTAPIAKAGLVGGSLVTLYGLPAQAAIIHVTIALPSVSYNNSDPNVLWDVDGAFDAEFVLGTLNGLGSIFLDSDGLYGSGMIFKLPKQGDDPIRNLATGFTVGPTLAATYQWDAMTTLNRSLVSGGQFLSEADGWIWGSNFIGFRFDANGQTLYGWGRIDASNRAGGGTLTIAEWAYEDSGASIRVGQTTSSSVPAPDSLALLALGAGGLGAWRRRKAQRRTSP